MGPPNPRKVEAIGRALDGETGCEQAMHLITGVHGAVAVLMAEDPLARVVEPRTIGRDTSGGFSAA